jgi:hypothetical protein
MDNHSRVRTERPQACPQPGKDLAFQGFGRLPTGLGHPTISLQSSETPGPETGCPKLQC